MGGPPACLKAAHSGPLHSGRSPAPWASGSRACRGGVGRGGDPSPGSGCAHGGKAAGLVGRKLGAQVASPVELRLIPCTQDARPGRPRVPTCRGQSFGLGGLACGPGTGLATTPAVCQ